MSYAQTLRLNVIPSLLGPQVVERAIRELFGSKCGIRWLGDLEVEITPEPGRCPLIRALVIDNT